VSLHSAYKLTNIEVAISDSRQMEALVCGLDKALCIIYRCKLYTYFYIGDDDTSITIKELKSTLMKLYVLILQFLCKAIQLYETNRLKRTIHAFWNLDEVIKFEEQCYKLEMQTEIAAKNCELVSSRNAHTEELDLLQEWSQETEDSINQLGLKLTTLCERSNMENSRDALNWASTIPCEDIHFFSRKGRTENTGEWLLTHSQYQLWRSSDKSMILWLHGIREHLLQAILVLCN
jgi:hypothetical protein